MSKEISKEASKDKIKALEMAISQIEKSFGKGAIMRLGAGEVAEGIQVIPTGSIALDMATGVGGYPRGRVVEIDFKRRHDEQGNKQGRGEQG